MSKENQEKWEEYHRENTLPALAKVELKEQPEKSCECLYCGRRFRAYGRVTLCTSCYIAEKL